MRGFCGMHKESGGSGRSQGRGDFTCDMAAFSDAADDNSSFARKKQFHCFDKGLSESVGQSSYFISLFDQHLPA